MERKENYWLVNIPGEKTGYSFMVYLETDKESDVADVLENHKEFFQDPYDFNYMNVVEATEDDYKAFEEEIINLEEETKQVVIPGKRYELRGQIENGYNPDGSVCLTNETVVRKVVRVEGDKIYCECGRVFVNNKKFRAIERLDYDTRKNIINSLRQRKNQLKEEIFKEISDEITRRNVTRVKISSIAIAMDFDELMEETIVEVKKDGDMLYLVNDEGEEFAIGESVGLEAFYILEDLLN